MLGGSFSEVDVSKENKQDTQQDQATNTHLLPDISGWVQALKTLTEEHRPIAFAVVALIVLAVVAGGLLDPIWRNIALLLIIIAVIAALFYFALAHSRTSGQRQSVTTATIPQPGAAKQEQTTLSTGPESFDQARYLRSKIDDWNQLRLFSQEGLAAGAVAPMTLSQLYVHMHTDRRHMPAGERSEPNEPKQQHQGPPITVLEALSGQNSPADGVILHGRPGIGKSSVVRYLCLHLAQALLERSRFDFGVSVHEHF